MHGGRVLVQRHTRLLVAPPPPLDGGGVLFLEHLRVLAVVNLGLVEAVLLHLVDEEEAQHLDTLAVERELPLHVVLDGAGDLGALDGLGGHVAQRLAEPHNVAVLELDPLVAGSSLNVVHDPAGLVVAVLLALGVQVVAGLNGDLLALLSAVRLPHIDGDFSGDGRACLHRLEPHIRAVEVLLREDRVDGNALNQAELEGIDRRQAEHLVVGLLVRGRVAQYEQRVQAADGLLALGGRVDALRLVDDHDGAARRYELLGALPADKPLARAMEDVALVAPAQGLLDLIGVEVVVLVEGPDVDDHHLDGARRGEVAHRPHVARVVDEALQRRVVVEKVEVSLHAPEALLDALADGHARHDDDELCQPVAAVEFVNGADIAVGLARARLHLHGEVAKAPVGGHARRLQGVALLDLVEVALQLSRREAHAVGVADLGDLPREEALAHLGHELRVHELLAAEQVADRLDGLLLVFLGS